MNPYYMTAFQRRELHAQIQKLHGYGYNDEQIGLMIKRSKYFVRNERMKFGLRGNKTSNARLNLDKLRVEIAGSL